MGPFFGCGIRYYDNVQQQKRNRIGGVAKSLTAFRIRRFSKILFSDIMMTGWWQLKCFLFSTRILGDTIQFFTNIDEHIFQMGWLDHQLDDEIQFSRDFFENTEVDSDLHLKMNGWKAIVSFWDGLFSGSGSVNDGILVY